MDYKAILIRGYKLVMRNPALWIFGLFLSSGFNLNIFYAIVSHRSGIVWDAMREATQSNHFLVGVGGASAIIVFILGNYLKAWFISETHDRMHLRGQQCPLCMDREQRQTWHQRLPNLDLLIPIFAASAVTISATLVAAVPLNYLLGQSAEQAAPALIAVTIIATLIVICGLACWNIFTVLQLIFYKQNFANAARLAWDLITLRAKHVFEFVFLLLVLYAAVVVIGSSLIFLAQLQFGPLPFWMKVAFPAFDTGKVLAGLLFAFWLAISNTFFNVALIAFFDQLVKPIEKPEPVHIPTTSAV